MNTKIITVITICLIAAGCNFNSNKDRLTKPLVNKNGLLYSDSSSIKPFSGRHKSKMLDMKIEYEVSGGIINGDFIIYFANNNIHMKGRMENNRNTGEWKYYFNNGAIQTVGHFKDDLPDGSWVWYNDKGLIIEEGSFIEGKREGEWKNYDSLGKVIVIRQFKNNVQTDSAFVD